MIQEKAGKAKKEKAKDNLRDEVALIGEHLEWLWGARLNDGENPTSEWMQMLAQEVEKCMDLVDRIDAEAVRGKNNGNSSKDT